MFSGLYRPACDEDNMLLITCAISASGSGQRIPAVGLRGQTYSRFQVNHDCPWNVVLIICLVEENVFPITTLCGPLFKDALVVDAVLGAQSLPEDGPDCKV